MVKMKNKFEREKRERKKYRHQYRDLRGFEPAHTEYGPIVVGNKILL